MRSLKFHLWLIMARRAYKRGQERLIRNAPYRAKTINLISPKIEFDSIIFLIGNGKEAAYHMVEIDGDFYLGEEEIRKER